MSSDEPVVKLGIEGPVAFLAFNRPDKRNAINDRTVEAMQAFFSAIPDGVKVVVLSGNGGHFSSGLDLSEQVRREPQAVLRHSRNWHAVTNLIQFGGVPVVAAMSGAVMGGGLEIAATCHVRVVESGALFRMPEAQRGIFVGGGGSVRLSAIIGPDRLTEMMLTGRTYSAEEGHQLGLAHYLVEQDRALDKARELALQIAGNSATINYLIVQSIGRIARMPPEGGSMRKASRPP